MQRIANPSTPVRFRPEPPFFSYINIAKHSRVVANSHSALNVSLVFQADYRLLDIAPIDPFFRMRERWPPNNVVSHHQIL